MPRQGKHQIAQRVATNIRTSRGEQSQRAFAKALDVDPSYVHRWETGKVVPSLTNIARLAEVSGYPPEWFFTEHDRVAA